MDNSKLIIYLNNTFDFDEDKENRDILHQDLMLEQETEIEINNLNSLYKISYLQRDTIRSKDSADKQDSKVLVDKNSFISNKEYETKLISILIKCIKNSHRTKVYLRRLTISSIFIILLTLIRFGYWIVFSLFDHFIIDSLILSFSSLFLICIHVSLVISIRCMLVNIKSYQSVKNLTSSIQSRLFYIFIFLVITTIIEIYNCIRVMVFSYTEYYKLIAANYSKLIGLKLTALIVIILFFVIIINVCLVIYNSLTFNKFKSYIHIVVLFKQNAMLFLDI